ncbi:bZIP transcription factor [Sporobolomyces koalae]|uniref:bZIP transcription factor n=1 Tax=Sporobolomyces koalae TaxID=500713 RepID=UPI0031760B17
MDVKPQEVVPGRYRASSDPLSRGGNFAAGSMGRLDQEPNPFEQSFSGPGPSRPTDGTITAGGRRARSTSPSSFIPRVTPGTAGSKMPPLSFMQTPGGSDLSNFGWGVDSLRSHPNGVGGGGSGGNAAVSFPPPSPATAALFAMMTNNTPGTADANVLGGGGPRPHEGPNEGNQFEASFARANSDSKLPPPASQDHVVPPPTQHHPQPHAGDLRQSAIMNGAGHPHLPQVALHHAHSHPGTVPSHAFLPPVPSHSYAGHPQHPAPPNPPSYPPLAAPHLAHLAPHGQPPQHHASHPHPHHHPSYNAAPVPPQAQNATNPLDLLTQASFHNDDAVVAAAALSGLATPGGGFNAAAVAALSASQKGQPPPNVSAPPPGVMPGSTVGGHANGHLHHQPSNLGVKDENGQPPRAKRAAGSNVGTNKRTKRGQSGYSEEPEVLQQQQLQQQPGVYDYDPSATKKSQPKRAASKRGAAKKKEEQDDFDENDSLMGGDDDDMSMMDDPSMTGQQVNKGGRGRKKDSGETEEEKRKNFLERNRQAALKCRQRKKAWLQSLQTKVELLTTDNDTLQTTVNNLTEEVNSLRAILAAHSNCPVAIANGAPPPQQQQQHPHPPPPPHHAMQGQPQPAYGQARY